MDEAKIRILVAHRGTKLLILIDPSRSIKDLKSEIVRVYHLNAGTQPDQNINGLQLLAYDGYTLCDQFVISDALYDGCPLTTLMLGKSYSTADHMKNTFSSSTIRNQLFPSTTLPGRPLLLPTIVQQPASSSFPVLPPPGQIYISTNSAPQTVTSFNTQSSPPLVSIIPPTSLMTPSTLTDLPNSQSDEAEFGVYTKISSASQLVSSDKRSQANSSIHVYDFPSEDSESPLASTVKKKNKRKQSKSTLTNTSRSKKQNIVPAASVQQTNVDSSDEDSIFETPTKRVNKRPPPKKKVTTPAKKKAKKNVVSTSSVPVQTKTSNIEDDEPSSSWSSVDEDDVTIDKKKELVSETNLENKVDEKEMSDTSSEEENSFEVPVVGDLPSEKQDNVTKRKCENKDIETCKVTSTGAAESSSIQKSNNDNVVNKTSKEKKRHQEIENKKHKHNTELPVKNPVTVLSPERSRHSTELSVKNPVTVLSPERSRHSTELSVKNPVTVPMPGRSRDNTRLSSIKPRTVQQPSPVQPLKNNNKSGRNTPSASKNNNGVSLSLRTVKNKEIVSSTVVPVPGTGPLFNNRPVSDRTPKKQIKNESKSKIVNSQEIKEEIEVTIMSDNNTSSSGEEDTDEETGNSPVQAISKQASASNVVETVDKKEDDNEDEINEVSDTDDDDELTPEQSRHNTQLSSVKPRTVQQPSPAQPLKNNNKSGRNTPSASKNNNGVSLSLRTVKNKEIVSSTVVPIPGTGPLFNNRPVSDRTPKKQIKNESKSKIANFQQTKQLEEEEVSTDDDDSSSSDDDSDETVDNDTEKTATQNKPLKSLQALATDADDTIRNVRMKSINLVPANSNVRKRLLGGKTSLIKKIPLTVERKRQRSFSSHSQPKQTKTFTTLKKKSRVSKTPALEGISREEEEMAFNLSQETSNLSKILDDENLW